ncbi:glycosyltransferase family 4 protein [Patescibacteria group bacterium]|nr:glycosyltransferase family 4 protein [Patescibacteria group bacterium]
MIIGIDASKLNAINPTGVEISTAELIRALLEQDRANTYWLYSPMPLAPEWTNFENVQNVIVPAKKLWTLWALSREIKKRPPEIFWSPSNFLPYNLPKKAVATIHDLAFHLFPRSYSLKSRMLSYFALNRAIKSASKLIAISRQTKRDIKSYFKVPGENIEVMHLGVRKDLHASEFNFEMNYPNLDKYFIYVGRIELRKNLPNIIRAFHQFINTTNASVKLLLCGSRGYGYLLIKRLVRKLKLEDKVVFLGYIEANHLPALYQKSLGVIFVSQYEGFGLNILEGFASNVPVLTSNFGAMAEIAGGAALLVDPNKVEEIARGYLELYQNENLRQVLIEKGQIRLQDFSWEKAAEKLMEIWKSL